MWLPSRAKFGGTFTEGEIVHPVIDEISRCYSLSNVQSTSFRQWQRILRDEVAPLLDERERLLVENAELREALDKASKRGKKEAATV